jgi:hypothetical protein
MAERARLQPGEKPSGKAKTPYDEEIILADYMREVTLLHARLWPCHDEQ